MTHVLVTGGGGFIGTHWCRALAAAGANGVVLDCNGQTSPLPPGWRYVRGDVRDMELVYTLVGESTRVVHLAAAHHDAGIPADSYADVNVQGTAVVLHAMSAHARTDIVFTSSVAVYGDAPGATETTTPRPVSPYGITKLAAEARIAQWVAALPGRRAIVLRPAVVIGPGHFANMYSLMKQIDSGFLVHVGTAMNVKSLSSARTVVEAGEWMRGHLADGFHVANVVSEPQLSSADIIRHVSRALGKRPPRFRIPLSAAMFVASVVEGTAKVMQRSTSISAARVRKLFDAETLFEPAYLRTARFAPTDTTEIALREMAEWFLESGRQAVRETRLPPASVVRQSVSSSRADVAPQVANG